MEKETQIPKPETGTKEQVNEKQQSKIIASLESGYIGFASESEAIEESQRDEYLKKIAEGKIGEKDYKKVLQNVRPPIFQEKDISNPTQLYESISENEHQQALIAKITKGSVNEKENVTPKEIYTILRKYHDPISFEKDLNNYLTQLEKQKSPEFRAKYEKVLQPNNLMHKMFGKQQEYYEQIKLMEKEAKEKYSTKPDKPKPEPEQPEQLEQKETEFEGELEANFKMELLKIYNEIERKGEKINLKLLKDKNYQKTRNENANIRKLVKQLQTTPGDKKEPNSVILAKMEEEALKQTLDKQKTIEEIGKNLEKQPNSVKSMYEYIQKKAFMKAEIGGHNFLLTKIQNITSEDKVVRAWVEDKANPGVWKSRFFRISNSDGQFKAIPGAEGRRLIKGEEKNGMHHYAQSGKLHKDMYKTINSLPQEEFQPKGIGEAISQQLFLKDLPNDNNPEFEFKEEYQAFKNEKWERWQKYTQNVFRTYWYFIMDNKTRVDWGQESDLYRALENNYEVAEMKNIKDFIDNLDDSKREQYLKGNSFEDLENIDDPEIKNFTQTYKENMGKYFERAFSPFPKEMMPDFSKEAIDSYEKKNPASGEKIHIEEYKVKNDEGDEIIFAMAYDNQGSVYIDNIYDPRVGMTNYGTLEKIAHMGYLVYKPEDYTDQTLGLPDKYRKDSKGEKYTDITELWTNVPVVKNFKAELQKRGES